MSGAAKMDVEDVQGMVMTWPISRLLGPRGYSRWRRQSVSLHVQQPGYLPESQHVVLIDHTIGSDYLQKEGRAGVILVLLFLM